MRHAISIAGVASFAIAIALCTSASASPFFITLTDFETSNLTPAEEAIFTQAASYWQNIITGYKSGITDLYGMAISVSSKPIDGVGNVLGSTQIGATSYRTASNGTTYTLPRFAQMSFDSADIDNMYSQGYLYPVVVHEIAHALGFGSLWLDNHTYVNDTGQYTGTTALSAYRTDFVGQSGAAFVPVELGGGAGTANYHWNEVDQGAGLTGIVDTHGRDMRYELMTGWMETWTPSSLFVSQTTIHQFEDLGYTVRKMRGDANLDGFVDGTDLNTVLSNYNATGMDWAHGDFNADGSVNGTDLNTLLSYYNQNNGIYGIYGTGTGGISVSMAVPEPACLALLASGLLSLLFCGWRRR